MIYYIVYTFADPHVGVRNLFIHTDDGVRTNGTERPWEATAFTMEEAESILKSFQMVSRSMGYKIIDQDEFSILSVMGG